MYEFIATVTNDYTIEIESNTYWSCKAEGSFKLSSYSGGTGKTTINIEIPDDIMIAEGIVYFSFGDERCKYPEVTINLANLCYISTYPNYNICGENREKTIYLFYEEPHETFNISVFCFDGWTVESPTNVDYITNNNELMIITGDENGELNIMPQHTCNNQNIIHIKTIKKQTN
jgi:hypothetical protein